MKKTHRFHLLFSFFLTFVGISHAQTDVFLPNAADARNLWNISDSTKLYVGASFYYMNPEDSIIVWLDTSDADTTGTLYFMVPGFRDSALALFTNRQYSQRVNVSALVPSIPVGTEIFFMYKRIGTIYPRYTGQNRSGIDPKDQIRYPGAKFVSRDFGLTPGKGHRFAVAGRLDPLTTSINDTVVFGFEDGGTPRPGFDSLIVSDFDFNDVIFRVVGLDLNVEAIPDSIVIICKDTALAGDSVVCRAEVWSDSGGMKVRSPRYDSLVTWSFSGKNLLGDTLIAVASAKNQRIFLARTAFERFTLRASLRSPFGVDTIRASKSLLVRPGPPRYLSIELRCDTASPNFSLHAIIQVSQVQIPSNTMADSLYAVARDRFGNFAGFFSSARWDTSSSSPLNALKTGVVTVSPGTVAKGEGIVTKGTRIGNELVIAAAASGADTLRDTVMVNVVAADYDSIRVCVQTGGSFAAIGECLMTMDQCSTFIAVGRRVDNRAWERIGVQWRMTPWLPSGPAGIDTIRFCPADTGSGSLSIDYQGRLKQTIAFRVVPGAPASIQCFTDRATPFPGDTIVSAGSILPLYGRVYDNHGIWLSSIPSTAISWKLDEHETPSGPADSSGFLTARSGASVTYYPRRARRSVTVTVIYAGFSDSLVISVQPGKPYRISIEPTDHWQASPYAPNPIDTLFIADDRTSESVWALTRDSVGNFVDFLTNGIWRSADTIISIRPGTKAGEGVVLKNLSAVQGNCAMSVSHSSALIPDTAFVKLLAYHYIALRVVNAAAVALESLTMSTNDDTTLSVQALRSDTTLWCSVLARWSISDGAVTAPAKASTFRFSPVKPDTGWVIVALAENPPLADTVPAIFTLGDPVRAELSLITPEDSRVAGETIRGVITIFNKDGPVPGDFCYGKGSPRPPSIYQDSLGGGNAAFPPIVSCAEGSDTITVSPIVGGGIAQCFHNGVDSVGFLLYYAPFTKDSLHRLIVKLGDIAASSAPFHLKPSVLARLMLDHSHRCCGDTLVLRYPRERAIVYATGYDRFGNLTGEENCTWEAAGTLHPITAPVPVSRIAYGADSIAVLRDEEGSIIARSSANTAISDSLWTFIIGPQAQATWAATRDDNGNGLLDRIVVRFTKPVYIKTDDIAGLFSVNRQGFSLPVDSVSAESDSVTLDVHLREKTGGMLQTGWTPVVSFSNTGFALGGATDSFSLEAIDGAGPVVDSVVKEFKGPDRKNDQVTVIFSEPVKDRTGNTISFLVSPDSLFSAWVSPQADSFRRIDMFGGISRLIAPTDPLFVHFAMDNGKELLPLHYVNFRTDPEVAIIEDKARNRPSPRNRKVKVIIKGEPPDELVIGPNPGVPTTLRERPGEFHLSHNPSAVQWVTSDRAGFVIRFRIFLPLGTARSVDGRLRIFDVIGNDVIGDPQFNLALKNILTGDQVIDNKNRLGIIPPSWTSDGTVYDYIVYWNGYTKEGMKAAPGIYKAILSLVITSNGRKEKKTLSGLIGITK